LCCASQGTRPLRPPITPSDGKSTELEGPRFALNAPPNGFCTSIPALSYNRLPPTDRSKEPLRCSRLPGVSAARRNTYARGSAGRATLPLQQSPKIAPERRPDTAPKDWAKELNEEAFKMLLAALQSATGDGTAEYLKLRRKVVKFFEFNRCQFADDFADVVMDKTADRLYEKGHIENIQGFVYGVARRVLLEVRRKERRRRKMLNGLFHYLQLSPDSYPVEVRHECLMHCLAELPNDRGDLMLRYYEAGWGEKGGLAAEFNKTDNALAQIIFHTKPKLRNCVENCLAKKLIR
jgi:DNA-directed RNA polymerase specialized sigma24 family protein